MRPSRHRIPCWSRTPRWNVMSLLASLEYRRIHFLYWSIMPWLFLISIVLLIVAIVAGLVWFTSKDGDTGADAATMAIPSAVVSLGCAEKQAEVIRKNAEVDPVTRCMEIAAANGSSPGLCLNPGIVMGTK